MKLVVQNNHLVGQILYRSVDPSKKRDHFNVIKLKKLEIIKTNI